MATVYLAKHQQTDRLVALKLLDPEISKDPAYVERFRREAKAAGRIRSDYVVAIYDLDAEVGGSLVLVMEYLEGQSVQQALKPGRMPIQRALSFGRQMLEGLAAAHEAGVIHRDLKPANLFIEKSTTGTEKVKLLDFGISKLADASQQELTRDGQTLGTVAYMAPEQIRGKAVASDGRVDLYSAGVSLFIMLTGKRPIDAEDTVQLLAAVLEHPPLTLSNATGLPFPAPVEKFIAKALEKDPNKRFQTALEMRDALVEAGKAVGYEQTGPLSVPTKSAEPSGVVRSPAKPSPGPAPQAAPQFAPPPDVHQPKQTMMGVGPAPAGPAMPMGHNNAVPMQPGFGQPLPTQGAPLGAMPAPYDPFGPPPNQLALPPSPMMAPVGYATASAPVAPEAPAKKSNAPMLIVLSAVGLVALGGAGAIVAKSMSNQQQMTRRVVDTNTAPASQSANQNNNGNNGNNSNSGSNGNNGSNGNSGNSGNTNTAGAMPAAANAPTPGGVMVVGTPPSAPSTPPANNETTGNAQAPSNNPAQSAHAAIPANNQAPQQPVQQPSRAPQPATPPTAQARTQPVAVVNANNSAPSTGRSPSSASSASGSRPSTAAATTPVASGSSRPSTGHGTSNSAIADIFGPPGGSHSTSSSSSSRPSGASATSNTTPRNTTPTPVRRPPRGSSTSVVPF
jgi:serine/threonine protein kinase